VNQRSREHTRAQKSVNSSILSFFYFSFKGRKKVLPSSLDLKEDCISEQISPSFDNKTYYRWNRYYDKLCGICVTKKLTHFYHPLPQSLQFVRLQRERENFKKRACEFKRWSIKPFPKEFGLTASCWLVCSWPKTDLIAEVAEVIFCLSCSTMKTVLEKCTVTK